MEQLLDLNEAAVLLGIKPPSLRRRLNSTGPDRIAGVKVKLGDREVWRVSRAAIEAALTDGAPTYDGLIQRWQEEQANGIHSGRHIGARRIQENLYGFRYYWRYLGQPPSLNAINADNLRQALAAIPVEYDARNCHFAIRETLYKSLISFTQMLVRIGLRSSEDLQAIRALKPKRIFPPRRTSLKPEGLDCLMTACQRLGGRTEYDVELMKTAVLLMGVAGLRRAEVIALEVGHLDLSRSELMVINGKGHKDRMVGLAPIVTGQLERWLAIRKPSRYPNVLIMDSGIPITANALQLRIMRLRKAAGLDITLHGLRRTCATLMVDSGVPLVHVQRNLGHRQISTTMQYVQTDQQTAAESFKRFSLGSLSAIPTTSPAPPADKAPVKPDDVLGFVKAKRGKK